MNSDTREYGIFKLHEDGILEAFGLRVVFFRLETRASIRASILDILGHDGGKVLLRIIGERIGSNSGKFAKGRFFKGSLDEEFEKFLKDVYLQSGRGKAEFERRDDKIIVRIRNSFEADAHMVAFGKSEEPACYFLQGYFTGLFSTLLGKSVTVEEIRCKAKGDEYCEFVVFL